MKFDVGRVGFGSENPLIKKGSRGFFSDNFQSLKKFVENENTDMMGILEGIDIDSNYPYI